MTSTCVTDILALGTVTGMRSMSGPAALALGQHGVLRGIVPLLAVGEMIADKSPFVGARTDPLPLAGRAVMGAIGLTAAVIASLQPSAERWLLVWLGAAPIAFAVGLLAMRRKAARLGAALAGAPGRRFALSLELMSSRLFRGAQKQTWLCRFRWESLHSASSTSFLPFPSNTSFTRLYCTFFPPTLGVT